MSFCFVITGHGYGHAARQMEIVRVLLARCPDARAAVLTAAPASIFVDYLGRESLDRLELVPWQADVGVIQRDSISMDPAATLEALDRAWGDPVRAELTLAGRLRALDAEIVIADVPAVAFGAAARLGVPSVAVASFDWAFIYGHYARREPAFERWARRCLEWQALADRAVHLEPGPPLVGFRHTIEAPPIARAASPPGVRARLRIPDGDRAVLVSFGGFGLDDAERRIPRIAGVTWILAPPMPDLARDDTRHVRDLPYLSLLAACDVVFTKPGYGIVCEAARHHTRILYTDRGDFPEYEWLVRWMHARMPAAHIPSGVLDEPGLPRVLEATLGALLALPGRWPAGPDSWNGAERAVEVILAA